MQLARVRRHGTRLGRLLRHPLADQLLCVHAFVLLGHSRWRIRRGGLKAVQAGLGERMAESPATVTAAHATEAERIAWAINGVHIYTPWLSNCFPQAVTAQRLLERQGIAATVYFGTAKGSAQDQFGAGDFAAHAWVRAGSTFVAGGNGHMRFSPIVWFSQPPLDE